MRFLICSLASHGFVYPSIGLGKGLQERGHEVALVTGCDFAGVIARAGLERIARSRVKDGPSFEIHLWYQPLSVAIQVKHLQHAIEQFRPDVLVGQQLCLAPFLMAEHLGLPLAVLGMAAYLWPASEELLSRPARSEQEARWCWRFADQTGYFNTMRELFKMPPSEADFRNTPLLGDLFLLRSVPELEGRADELPPKVHFVGDCLWEPEDESDEALKEWLREAAASGEPVLYVQQGATFNLERFWPHLLESCAAHGRRIVASVGRMHGELDSAGLPDGVLARPHVPQAAVLPHAAGVVCAANGTACLGALRHGVPLLLFPGGGEQLDVAERCVAAGAALSADPDGLDAASFGRLLDELLERDDLRHGAGRMGDAFRAEPPFAHAVSLIDQLASTSDPVLRESSDVAATA
jgi:UDP:flavonoid glycosyltransferase YjiC (YdhE family)